MASDQDSIKPKFPTCFICKKSFSRPYTLCRHLTFIHNLEEDSPELNEAKTQKTYCPYCKRYMAQLREHYQTCYGKKVADEVSPEKSHHTFRLKTNEDVINAIADFAKSRDGGECKKKTVQNYTRQVWRMIEAESLQDNTFRARHWITISTKFRPISRASEYLSSDMSKTQEVQFLCAYALLCKFLEFTFYDLKAEIEDYGTRLNHLGAMRNLQKSLLKTSKKSLQFVPTQKQAISHSTLELLTDALQNSRLRRATVKRLSRSIFYYDQRIGIKQKRDFGHVLAVSFHLCGAGNRWDVTENLKVSDVMNAVPSPKRCEACKEHKVDFAYHLEKQCPDGKILYQTRELPKSSGWIVYRDSHKTGKTRGEMATYITNRLREAILNYAKFGNLCESDLAFPGDLLSPKKGMKFYRHGRPIVRAICPELTERAESEFEGKLPSNFIRKKGMTNHVLANVPEGCERLGGSAETARKNYLSQDLLVEERIKDSIRVIGDIEETEDDTESVHSPSKGM